MSHHKATLFLYFFAGFSVEGHTCITAINSFRFIAVTHHTSQLSLTRAHGGEMLEESGLLLNNTKWKLNWLWPLYRLSYWTCLNWTLKGKITFYSSLWCSNFYRVWPLQSEIPREDCIPPSLSTSGGLWWKWIVKNKRYLFWGMPLPLCQCEIPNRFVVTSHK